MPAKLKVGRDIYADFNRRSASNRFRAGKADIAGRPALKNGLTGQAMGGKSRKTTNKTEFETMHNKSNGKFRFNTRTSCLYIHC